MRDHLRFSVDLLHTDAGHGDDPLVRAHGPSWIAATISLRERDHWVRVASNSSRSSAPFFCFHDATWTRAAP